MNASLSSQSCYILAGPSQSGKTQWMLRMLRYRADMLEGPTPRRLVWCFGVKNSAQETELRSAWQLGGGGPAVFVSGFPTDEDFFHPNDFVVVDDLQSEVAGNALFTSLFTRLAHHLPLCCFYLCQNLFHRSDGESRSRSLSAGFICLMRNVRDKTSVAALARQMFPGRPQLLQSMYTAATSKEPYSYLLIDLRQQTPHELRFRSRIFPSEGPQHVYIASGDGF
jgi:hypothetical protein